MVNEHGQVVCDITKICLEDGPDSPGQCLYEGYIEIKDGLMYRHFTDDPNNAIEPFINGTNIPNPEWRPGLLKSRKEFRHVTDPAPAPQGVADGHYLDLDVIFEFIAAKSAEEAAPAEETPTQEAPAEAEAPVEETSPETQEGGETPEETPQVEETPTEEPQPEEPTPEAEPEATEETPAEEPAPAEETAEVSEEQPHCLACTKAEGDHVSGTVEHPEVPVEGEPEAPAQEASGLTPEEQELLAKLQAKANGETVPTNEDGTMVTG